MSVDATLTDFLDSGDELDDNESRELDCVACYEWVETPCDAWPVLDIGTTEPATEAVRPDWNPNNAASTNGKKCQNCDGDVTPRFARVFGDNSDEVWACRECTPMREIHEGGAARP